jgi:hypothetical protein
VRQLPQVNLVESASHRHPFSLFLLSSATERSTPPTLIFISMVLLQSGCGWSSRSDATEISSLPRLTSHLRPLSVWCILPGPPSLCTCPKARYVYSLFFRRLNPLRTRLTPKYFSGRIHSSARCPTLSSFHCMLQLFFSQLPLRSSSASWSVSPTPRFTPPSIPSACTANSRRPRPDLLRNRNLLQPNPRLRPRRCEQGTNSRDV